MAEEQAATAGSTTPTQEAPLQSAPSAPTEPPKSEQYPHAERRLQNKTLRAVAIKRPDLPRTFQNSQGQSVTCYHLIYVPDGVKTREEHVPCTKEVWTQIRKENYPKQFRIYFTLYGHPDIGVVYRIVPDQDARYEMKPDEPQEPTVILRSYPGGNYHPDKHPTWMTQTQLDEITELVNQDSDSIYPKSVLFDRYQVDGINYRGDHTELTVRVL